MKLNKEKRIENTAINSLVYSNPEIFFFKFSSGYKVMFKLSVLRRVHHLIETIVI